MWWIIQAIQMQAGAARSKVGFGHPRNRLIGSMSTWAASGIWVIWMATERNTFPCRGCGKPFLEDGPRKAHESSCPQAPDPEDRQEAEPDAEPAREPEVQPTPEAPADPRPEPQGKPTEEPHQQPHIEEDAGCSCCGADPGSLSINGMCYGCELAGCDPDSLGCDHLPGGG